MFCLKNPPQGGYPIELFESVVPEDLKCGICLNIVRDAIRCCDNEHVYCKGCLKKVVNMKCPACRDQFTPFTIRESKIVNRLISTLRVRCCTAIVEEDENDMAPKKQRQEVVDLTTVCDWMGCLGDLDRHVELCAYVVVNCQYNGCSLTFPRRYTQTHETICEWRENSCPLGCGQRFPIVSLLQHQNDMCSNRMSVCLNVGCEAQVMSKDMLLHTTTCDFQMRLDAKCTFDCERKSMPNHYLDTNVSFLFGLMVEKYIIISIGSKESKEEKRSVPFIAFGRVFKVGVKSYTGGYAIHFRQTSRVDGKMKVQYVIGNIFSGRCINYTSTYDFQDSTWGFYNMDLIPGNRLITEDLLTPQGGLQMRLILSKELSGSVVS